MASEQLTFGIKRPDADNLVWLRYDGSGRRLVSLGSPDAPEAAWALRNRTDSAALGRQLGHLANASA